MVTPSRRTQANKQNAMQSTGPRTAAGKAASSSNAVQHGILSRHLILPGESRDEFDLLLQQLITEQQPVRTLEQALVERMAGALWRHRRLVAAETAQLQLQQTRQAALQPRAADVLSRCQSSLDNDLYKAVRVLRETQRHRIEQAALTAKPIVPMGSKA